MSGTTSPYVMDASVAIGLGIHGARFLLARTRTEHQRASVASIFEDIVQEVALGAVLNARRGYPTVGKMARLYAIAAMRRLLGFPTRGPIYWTRCIPREDVASLCGAIQHRREDGALALWRLQKAWPTLTDNQKNALAYMLTDGAAGKMGRSPQDHNRAWNRAVERVDNPAQFKRAAKCQTDRATYKREWKRAACS